MGRLFDQKHELTEILCEYTKHVISRPNNTPSAKERFNHTRGMFDIVDSINIEILFRSGDCSRGNREARLTFGYI